jgi:hypothetical protein
MPESRKHVPAVHHKIKLAAEYLALTPGATLETAAAHCGMSLPRLRDKLKRPHNLAYVKQVRDLAVEALATSGPATLAKVIQENTNQMATVAAVKTAAELLRRSAEDRAAAALRQSPGLIIMIGQPSGGPVIEQKLAGARTVEAGAYEPVPAEVEANDVPAARRVR